jgi:hypothetical protein
MNLRPASPHRHASAFASAEEKKRRDGSAIARILRHDDALQTDRSAGNIDENCLIAL